MNIAYPCCIFVNGEIIEMRFSNQLEMYSNESFEGYLHRLAIINHRMINDFDLE
ncbi:hypothetical protein QFZ78_002730 [Paenibacillus sp. V4I5]|nr:hypothetical protein [Paenibacillus sp. V4I5]